MSISTYEEFQELEASEKEGLVIVEASKRLMGWVLHSGSVYKITAFDHPVLSPDSPIQDSGVALVDAGTLAAISAGKYFHDRDAQVLYLQSSDSVNPNAKFISLTFRLFFSKSGRNLPHDLETGFEVHWLSLVQDTSDFGVGLDNQNQLGEAIDGTGSIDFYNQQDFWAPIYDKLYFENQRVFVYSWNPGIPLTESKLIFKGRIQSKTWDPTKVRFTLYDQISSLRAPVALSDLSEVIGARIPDGLLLAKQRRLYGYLFGHRPTNIDQILNGYPLSGTFSISGGDVTLTGVGTIFLSQLSPGDQVRLGSDTDEDLVTIDSIISDTSATITETYNGTNKAGETATIRPQAPIRYANRTFIIAGHALREPSTTVLSGINTSMFTVNDPTDLRAGDSILVGAESAVIQRIFENKIKLNTALELVPSAGDSVIRPALTNVYLNNRKLQQTRDYIYDATTAMLTLDPLAEFNVAPVKFLRGTLTFTSSSRDVSGSGTFFDSDISPGDWIRASGEADYFEVLSVTDATNLILRSPATYSVSLGALIKRPDTYNEGTSVLSCDVLGATDDGTSNGALLKTAPEIVEHLLTDAGLGSSVNTASFILSKSITSKRLGVAIPKLFSDKKSENLRDIINEINKSDFGSLIQNEDFELEYLVLSPDRPSELTRWQEHDSIKFSVQSASDKIVKTSYVNYGFKEYDPTSKGGSNFQESYTSDNAQFLAAATKEFFIDTMLIDQRDAEMMASRWAFLFEVSSSVLKIETKMQGIRLKVGDKIELAHEKLYQRFGSTSNRKVAAIQSSRKSLMDSSVDLEDLAGAFTRCAVVAENTALDYIDAGERERSVTGYITGNYGYLEIDASDFGLNVMW
jgi:hypothetical protein